MEKHNSNDRDIEFFKMSGHGNDFVVIDNMDGSLSLDWPDHAALWCRRRIAVGADGLLVMERSEAADFRLRIFNADGSEAEMCGNGARCAAVCAAARGRAGSHMTFETLAGIIRGRVAGDRASIQLTDPEWDGETVELDIDGTMHTLYCVNTGVPHAILFVQGLWDMSDEEVQRKGSLIRFHRAFEPEGTNVDFVEPVDRRQIHLRTYERGVEDETMACGTGAAASALITHRCGKGGPPPFDVTVGGGTLEIDFREVDKHISEVWLTGDVTWSYRGYLSPEEQ